MTIDNTTGGSGEGLTGSLGNTSSGMVSISTDYTIYTGATIINWSAAGTSYPYITVDGGSIVKKEGIGPKLYFRFVKSKLTKLQQEKLTKNLIKLRALLKESKELGQQALYEELSKQLFVTIKELEFLACGFDKIVQEDSINKFRNQVKDNVVYFKKLEDFPRAIPANVNRKLKTAQKLGLFDEYWVLYIDYTGEKLKTTKEKIREKDPILFGKLNVTPGNLYFIADWIDEYCDITLGLFVDKLKETDPEYAVGEIKNITKESFEQLKKEVIGRYEKLKDTNRDNYKQLMEEEEKAWNKPKVDRKKKNSFLKKIYKMFIGGEK